MIDSAQTVDIAELKIRDIQTGISAIQQIHRATLIRWSTETPRRVNTP